LTSGGKAITNRISLRGKRDESAHDCRSALLAGPRLPGSAKQDEETGTVKRIVIILAGVATLAAYLSSHLFAQNPAAPVQPQQPPVAQPRPLQTRIGLMNMVHVLKHYKKFQTIEESVKKRAGELQKSLEPFQTELIQLRTRYQEAKTSPEEREKIEYRMKQLQLDAQQKEEEAKKELVKINGDAAKMIYKEVEDAVNSYARSNSLELVLFYNDAITAEDYYHPANIQRKLTTPAAMMPMFVTPGMDISNSIVATLNARVAPTAAAPVAPPAGAPRPQ
jgi:Skp family chaperone for outer membrane proteins